MDYSYEYDRCTCMWIGLLVDDDNVIITVGAEFTREKIETWCKESLKSWKETGKELPDAYDRCN